MDYSPAVRHAGGALTLPIAVGYVIPDGVAEDVLERIHLAHVGAPLPDHSNELALVVQTLPFLGHRVDRDRVEWAGEGRRRFVLLMRDS
jgi:hypothetical protein